MFVVKLFRWIVASPFLMLLVTAWLASSLLRRIGRVLDRASLGSFKHVYWPLLCAWRIVYGKPRWEPEDCYMLGAQPYTKAERERALASPMLFCFRCDCGKSDCKAPAPNGLFIPNPTWRPRR